MTYQRPQARRNQRRRQENLTRSGWAASVAFCAAIWDQPNAAGRIPTWHLLTWPLWAAAGWLAGSVYVNRKRSTNRGQR